MAGTRLLHSNIHDSFQRMLTEAKLPARSRKCRPRIHDLRHSFAVASMLAAYTARGDGQAQLMLVSAYLGYIVTLSIISTARNAKPFSQRRIATRASHARCRDPQSRPLCRF